MDGMFGGCGKMKNITLSNANSEITTSMMELFYACTQLEKADLSNFKAKVTNVGFMFYECKSFKYVNIINLDTTDAIKDSMFGICAALKKENVITKDQNILDKFEELGGGQEEIQCEGGAEGGEGGEGGEVGDDEY